MPRKQVYGKRANNVYSNFAGFTSPVKPEKQAEVFEVIEIADELSRLTVHDKTAQDDDSTLATSRRAFGRRDSNATVRRSKTQQPTICQADPLAAKENKRTPPAPQLLKCVEELPVRTKDETDAPESKKLAREVESPVSASVLEADCTTQPAPEQLTHPGPAPAVSNTYTSHASCLLALSSQPLVPFATWSEQLSEHFAVAKIAEASYGEVYRLSLLRPHPTLGKTDESVLKIIALKPPPATKRKMTKAAKKRAEMMSAPEDVAGEVRLMQRMTTIPGYTNFRECTVLQGKPGGPFVSAWHSWNEAQKSKGKETSVFPDPAKKSTYSEEQLWAVIEMQDAGNDLENTPVDSIWMLWDIFWGVVLALCQGEDEVRFEHRDLHMGNICVSRKPELEDTKEKSIDASKTLGFTRLEATLIDYTLSRAELTRGLEDVEDVAYLDLERDLSLFEGDAAEEYQYEMYRHMRAAMFLDDPLADLWERWDEAEASKRTWRGYHPQTNLVWLHFILHKLLEQMPLPSNSNSPTQEGSTSTQQRALDLEKALLQVRHLLDPREFCRSGLKSAGDLVQLAFREGWLDMADVRGTDPAPGRRAANKRTKRRKGTASKK